MDIAAAPLDEPGIPPDLHNPIVQARFTPAALRAMTHLADAWNLSDTDVCTLLGGLSADAWNTVRTAGPETNPEPLTADQLTRVSHLLRIYRNLHSIYDSPLADAWVNRRNTNAFYDGGTPLAAMVDGGAPALIRTCALLDSVRYNG
jgi:hypothetical protein